MASPTRMPTRRVMICPIDSANDPHIIGLGDAGEILSSVAFRNGVRVKVNMACSKREVRLTKAASAHTPAHIRHGRGPIPTDAGGAELELFAAEQSRSEKLQQVCAKLTRARVAARHMGARRRGEYTRHLRAYRCGRGHQIPSLYHPLERAP